MYKSLFFAVVAIIGTLAISNCSSSSSSTAATATTLSALPTASGPVTSSSIHKLDLQTDATTGIRLTALAGLTWNTTHSGPMCQVSSSVVRLLSEASQPDKILCYVGAMEANGAFTASYDGTDKYYTLTVSGRPESAMKIKFNITKTAGAITDFKMWMCQDGSRRAYAQSEYVSTSLSAGTATVTSVGVHTGNFGTGSQRTVATGGFNSSGNWTSKTITHTGAFSGGSGGSAFSHSQSMSLTQGTDSFTLSGYHNGYYGGTSNTQTGRFYSVIQALGLSNLSTASIGSGTAKYAFSFPGGGGGTDTKSWHGDTRLPEASGTASYFTTVDSQTLPTAASITAPTFAGAEIWDCSSGSATSEAISMANPSAALQSAITACDTKFGFSSNEMMNCSGGKYD